MPDYGLQKCPNKWCGALFKPGNCTAHRRPDPSDTSGRLGQFVGRIPENVCPICRKPFKPASAAA